MRLCILALSGNIFISTKHAFLSHSGTSKTDGPVFWFHYQVHDLTPNTPSGLVSQFLLVSTNLPFVLPLNSQPISVRYIFAAPTEVRDYWPEVKNKYTAHL